MACINFAPVWGNKAANLEQMKATVREAAQQGNELVVFPELALSGYECSEDLAGKKHSCRMHLDSAERVPGPSTEEMAKLAKDLDIYIIFGLPEQDASDPEARYIASAVISPEKGILGTYRKIHLPPWPRFTESLCFSPGNSLPVWPTRYGLIGVTICYDFYFFPELTRIMALKGARLLVNSSASTAGPGKSSYIVQQTGCRATENLVFAASANLVGTERTKSYYGHSVIAGPHPPKPTNIFAEGGEGPEIVSATLNFRRLEAYARLLDWRPGWTAEMILRELNRIRKSESVEPSTG